MGDLPVSFTRRIMKLVERSASNRSRPVLPPEYEDQLRPVHAGSAACYASMEDLGDRLERFASQIDETPVEVTLSEAGIVTAEIGDDISVVNHMEDVREELRESESSMRLLSLVASQTR